MKKILMYLCVLSIIFSCGFLPCTLSYAAENNNDSIIDWFSNASNYSGHHYGSFGGVSRESDSVRVLAKTSRTSEKHIGFMIKKQAIESLVDDGYKTISFKMSTEAYQSNPIPGFVNVYASGVDAASYQLSVEKGTRNGIEDVFYASGSVVEIDLIKLLKQSNFDEGLKFVLKKAAASGNPAGAPAYLVMSDFKCTMRPVALNPFEQMTYEESYMSFDNGEFDSVTVSGENSVKILANKKNNSSGFALKKDSIEKILLMRFNEMTVTLNPSYYNSGSVPKYVVLSSPESVDYVVDYESVATKVEDGKLFFTAGTTITIKLEKLYSYISDDKGLEFTMLNGDSLESGSDTAYLGLDNLSFSEKWYNYKYDLVCSNGDFVGTYGNETTWAKMTEKSIRAVAKAGFKYIDISLYRLRNDSDLMKAGWMDIVNDLKSLADELGIKFRQAHSPGYTSFGSDEWINTNKRSIDICKMLGIENLVVHATGGASKDEFFAINSQGYATILPYAAENGVNILCENSTSKNMGAVWYINDGADMREFIKYVQALGYSNFHGCWDTGHANCEGSQYLDILALGDEIYGIHFHDNLGTDTHMIPYYGNMDIDEVMRALKVIGYSGYFTLETDGSSRVGSTYTGPELKGGLNPYTTDRFEQQEIIYQIMNYILEKYDREACASHLYGEAVVTKEATESETGIKTFTCTSCGAVKQERIPCIPQKSDNSVNNENNTALIVIIIGCIILVGVGVTVTIVLIRKKHKTE